MSFNEIFDWVCFQSPWWAKVLMVIGFYTMVFVACGITDHFNPYLKD